MSGTSGDAIARAETYLGVSEQPPGSNMTRVGQEFGWNGVAWCCEFMSVVLGFIGMGWYHTAGVHQARTWAQQGYNGLQWITDLGQARPGDIFVLGDAEHTGMVAYLLPGGGFVSIEGNWSDMVCRVTRSHWEDITGLIRPPYADANKLSFPIPAGAPTPSTYVLNVGDKGWGVQMLQLRLNNIAGLLTFAGRAGSWGQIAVDGDFGPATQNALAAFQLKFGMTWESVPPHFGPGSQSKMAQVEAFCGIRY